MKVKAAWYEIRLYPSRDGGIVWKHTVTEDGKYSMKIVADCPNPDAAKAAKRLMEENP